MLFSLCFREFSHVSSQKKETPSYYSYQRGKENKVVLPVTKLKRNEKKKFSGYI